MNLQTYAYASPASGLTASASSFADERLPRLSVIVISGALCVSGTSSAEPMRLWEAPYVHAYDATASGAAWEDLTADADERESEVTQRAVSELRRISGLTWEQLGQLFGVSRRSVHFWASGKPLNAGNEERLLRVLDVVRVADRGDARSTRSALFEVHEDTTAFELLVTGRFAEARSTLGAGAGRRGPALGELSAEAKAARAPLLPEELVEARHDRVHRDPGRARAARTVRNTRRGTP